MKILFGLTFVINAALAASNSIHKLRTNTNNFDIWNSNLSQDTTGTAIEPQIETIDNSFDYHNNNESGKLIIQERRSKVLRLFPVPVDGECLSNDGRQMGLCYNIYECRLKGGIAKGECALGFGVCCIFIASCNSVISNNITYLMSPSFPSPMSNNITSCKVKVKLINSDISQLRVDFIHFSLGQPNRQTGDCDGDIFKISGGPSGEVSLCGQNSGQHVYYDTGGRSKARKYYLHKKYRKPMIPHNGMAMDELNMMMDDDDDCISISMYFSDRFLPTRLWEIRIAQIPFSQRAPAGCLQYYTGSSGVVQTFNFADNGRHLANQNYKICIKQNAAMCSIAYEPCDDHSFRIGPTLRFSDNLNLQDEAQTTTTTATKSTEPPTTITTTTTTTTTDNDMLNTTVIVTTTTQIMPNETTPTPPSNLNDTLEEGSGGGDELQMDIGTGISSTQKPNKQSGGFDIISFFRSGLFDYRKEARAHTRGRQLYSTCNDRITMPCIIEDFIGPKLGPIPGCEPVHCGNKFCSADIHPCRIESTVTPFYLGIRFGNGYGKGSPEDNIGACIKYNQVKCM